MAVNTRKRKISDRALKIILCSVLYGLLIVFIGGLFLLSANYQKVYSSPTVSDGKADFDGVDILSRDVACTLAGEWEFFYNKWIITDNEDCESDGMIKLPSVWTYKDYGSGKLPKTGYASYRLIVENVQPDIDITVYRHNSDFAYRVFMNGQLNVRSGTVSKNPNETKVSGTYDEKIAYRTDGSPIEIVIELSASKSGGLNAAPWLHYDWSGDAYGSRLRSFTFIALGISFSAVAISILAVLFFRYKRDFTIPLFLLALFVHFVASKDMMQAFPFIFPFTATAITRVISALVAFILFIVFMRSNGVQFKRIPLILTSVAAAVFTVLLFVFYGTPVAPVFAFLLLATGCYYLVPITCNNKNAVLQRVVYSTLFAVMMSVFCFELCDGLGLFVFGTEFIFSFELMLIIACFAALWLWKLAQDARKAIRVSELECELHSVKNQALKAQIKPHFIYNSLTAIQARYRDGLSEGDKAIEQFAKHLRLITDSNGEDLIPFDDEVRNVLNYFELENLRAGGKLNLLLDLNYTDFSVPVLSLQPLVENAVRHGGLRERQDGYIQLFSEKTQSAVVITVSDNGNGFDVNTAREGVGIENTRKRFEMVGATLQIESSLNCGTKVTVCIPLE